MTAPRSLRELEQDLAALDQGPLDAEDRLFMERFGDAVHARWRWFM
jgi:hypothetical protein